MGPSLIPNFRNLNPELVKGGQDDAEQYFKEGRIAWNCGLVLAASTANYHHAHAYADASISRASGQWIVSNY